MTGGKPVFFLVCDGGSLGNPGQGYGSFRLSDSTHHQEIVRLDFGDGITSNQAEYRTLIAGIEGAVRQAATHGVRPECASLVIRTDSKLLVEQVAGRWKVRHPDLQPLHARARALLRQFGDWEISWQPRAETVRVLGH